MFTDRPEELWDAWAFAAMEAELALDAWKKAAQGPEGHRLRRLPFSARSRGAGGRRTRVAARAARGRAAARALGYRLKCRSLTRGLAAYTIVLST